MAKPSKILELERAYEITLKQKDDTVWRDQNYYRLDGDGKIVVLNLSGNGISDLSALSEIVTLNSLDLKNNQITEIKGLENLSSLNHLYLGNNKITEIKGLENLSSLNQLDLNNNQIMEIKGLENLSSLNHLYLGNNKITEIKGLENLTSLKHLYLNFNQITDIKGLENLTSLSDLYLGNNKITEIKGLENLLKKLTNLNELEIWGNPFEAKFADLKLSPFENNLQALKNYLALISADDATDVATIQKVMLVGNHSCGKSTFLDYFLTGRIKKQNSTHILKVQEYPKDGDKKAVFYDFGGQDYYHGIYKAFMTNQSLNLVFWKNDTDNNKKGDDTNGGYTQNFNKEYWIKQIHHYGNDNESWLIQTHVDDRMGRNPLGDGALHRFIADEYHITLRDPKRPNLIALRDNLKNAIDESNKKTRKLSKKYKEFLENEVYGYGSHEPIKVDELKQKLGEISGFDFREQLKQLTLQGEILYCDAMPDTVWLSPKATVEHIHTNVFEKEAMRYYRGKAPKAEFENICDLETIKMLEINKVVYLDKTEVDSQFYIIPSYLPYAEESGGDFFMFANFATPSLVLKFGYFIPFGFINQLVCHYGDLKEAKRYWRDVLMFTVDEKKTRVLIRLDFENLLIKIFVFSDKTSRTNEVTKIIFDDLLAFYYDDIPDYKSKLFPAESSETGDDERARGLADKNGSYKIKCPDDLYICIDNRYFVLYDTLQDTKTTTQIPAYELKGKELDKENPRTLGTRAFAFTAPQNKGLKNMTKIFISYSRKDIDYRDELRKHLSLLKRFDIADNWACEDMQIGKWHEQIQKKLEESDIIVYMLSANFFSSAYILEQEVVKGLEMAAKDNPKKILPVIVSEFVGLEKLKKAMSNTSKEQEAILGLGDFQFLAYGTSVNRVTGNAEEKIMSLKEFSNKNELEKGLSQIVEKILEIVGS